MRIRWGAWYVPDQASIARRWLPAMLVGVLAAAMLLATRAAGQTAGADLTVEISLDPPTPALNQSVTVNLVVRNIGTTHVASTIALHAFLNLAQPPDGSTPGASFTVAGLNAGAQYIVSIPGVTFNTEGCAHNVYAWVDRAGAVAESNEANNLTSRIVCVGNLACTADGYEGSAGDDLRTNARWFGENLTQARSLCQGQQPTAADRDWVKFTVFSGVTYTLAATNPQPHALPVIDLDASCGVVAAAPNAITWHSPANGVCYASVGQGGSFIGPLTAYSLTLTSATGIVDAY